MTRYEFLDFVVHNRPKFLFPLLIFIMSCGFMIVSGVAVDFSKYQRQACPLGTHEPEAFCGIWSGCKECVSRDFRCFDFEVINDMWAVALLNSLLYYVNWALASLALLDLAHIAGHSVAKHLKAE